MSTIFGQGDNKQDLVMGPSGALDAPTAYGPASAATPVWVPWLGYGLAVLPLGLCMAEVTRPSLWLVAALLVCPLAVLGLVLYAPASFEVTHRRSFRKSINLLVCLSVVPLFVVNTFRPQIDTWWPLLPGAMAAAAVLAVAWTAKERTPLASPFIFMVFLTLFAGAYGYGAVAVANVQFDSSPGSVIPVQVAGKYTTYGRHGSVYYHFQVPAWGPRTAPSSLDVSQSTYDRVAVGDNICVTLHPGVLALPWYKTALCS